jgi:hypothetical protein
MTTPERLALLLPLANGDQLSVADLGSRVFRFLQGFEARGLRLPSGEQELWDVDGATASELKAVAKKVERVFETGFMFEGPRAAGTEGIGPDDIRLPLTFPSVRFGAFIPPPGRRRADRRFTQVIEAGRLRDLVSYLAMYLLTTGAIAIERCPAPRYRNWKERCDRFFILGGQGRPSKTCSQKCASRVKAKRVNEQQRREREAWKAAQRKKTAPRKGNAR